MKSPLKTIGSVHFLLFGPNTAASTYHQHSVFNIQGDPIPGPRHLSGFHTSPFPWRETIDIFENVAAVDAFRMSMQLSRHGLIAGPSSGQALCGLLSHLQTAKGEGRLAEYADVTTGEINAVFICADLPYQYMDLYFKKIPREEFPPTFNEVRYLFLVSQRCLPVLGSANPPNPSRISSPVTSIPTTSAFSSPPVPPPSCLSAATQSPAPPPQPAPANSADDNTRRHPRPPAVPRDLPLQARAQRRHFPHRPSFAPSPRTARRPPPCSSTSARGNLTLEATFAERGMSH